VPQDPAAARSKVWWLGAWGTLPPPNHMDLARKKTLGIIFITAIGVLGVVCVMAFRHLGMWLVPSDPPPQSLDAYFTFASDNERIIYSKHLYNRYRQALWILSYPRKRILVTLHKAGIDTSRIIVVDTCANTSSEVACIVNWVNTALRDSASVPARRLRQRPGFDPSTRLRIGLVSSPYHMRRIKILLFGKRPDKGAEFYFLPVPFWQCGVKKHDYETWWKNKLLAPVVWTEFGKSIYAFWCGLWR
jgi:hypothetical protein